MTPSHRPDREVLITGIGMVTPAGVGTAASWRAVCEGAPTGAAAPALSGLPVDFACTVPSSFDPLAHLGAHARRMDRFIQLAVVAAREAVTDAGLGTGGWDAVRVGVVVGAGVAGVTTWETQTLRLDHDGPQFVAPLTVPAALASMAAARVSMDLAVHGPSHTVSTACASGTTAIGTALDLLRAQRCDIVLAGGTEAAVSRLTASAFHRLGALSTRRTDPAAASRPFDRDRDGFVLGEGAAVLVLETTLHACARNARAYARLLGYGATSDAHHLTDPDPEGRGAELALRQALADADVTARDIAHVNAHATGTPRGDAAEAHMLQRLFTHGPCVSSAKGVTGHLLAAAGAVEAALTALTIHHGLIPPTANLHTPDPALSLNLPTTAYPGPVPLAVTESFGFGGQNAALVLATV
ncbi:beta-ketoacyl-[acyl-carrier-protein] synthase family protein [Streptomyces sp. NPDC127068]|uniref:beta-ketoacyl-[acyl-carrier-protein] synthase family protein n=1 Tax=Streptomyces sp. NPDC127068 TaxID=3347127 RepID=UPI003649EEBD